MQQCEEESTRNWPSGMLGCDPPYDFFESTVSAAAELQPDAILFTGDYTRHEQNLLENPADAVSDIIRNTTAIIANVSPTWTRKT